MVQDDATHAGVKTLQTLLQAPQFRESLVATTSHPLVATLSQFRNPGKHEVTTQVPAAQAGMSLTMGQLCPHDPA